MALLDRLPTRPTPRTVAAWVVAIVLLRAVLVALYMSLGNVQAGEPADLMIELLDEFTAAIPGLALAVVVAAAAAYWPLDRANWRRSIVPIVLVFFLFSVSHTLAMELLRGAFYPLLGRVRELSSAHLLLAIGHEMPNDVFFYALFVSGVGLWRFSWEVSEREHHAVELRRSLAEAQLTSLRLQLQPHFLFNALNTVSSVMYDDPRRADSMLGELAELLRASLRTTDRDAVPLRDEIAIAERYVRLQRERFGERLRVSFDVADDCMGVPVPVFLLQPLIENAVRHGRVERLGEGVIRVTAHRDHETLELTVWDDGTGEATTTPGTGLGLRATAERLRLLYGEASTFSAGPADAGWRVRIAIPVHASN
jgi:two-component system LytT family sensor kinase